MRTIMIFPQFENGEKIDRIRRACDPLADKVRPHITLVFPFESVMTDAELSDLMDAALGAFSPFSLSLGRIGRHSDAFGHFLFLPVQEGAQELRALHQRLYDTPLRVFDAGLPYAPHLTVGRFDDAQALEAAYERFRTESDVFTARVESVCVERIGAREESILLFEKTLSAALRKR